MAFNSEEHRIIINSTVTADKNDEHIVLGGNDTTDKVYILSQTELDMYYKIPGVDQYQSTAYCYAQGAVKSSKGNTFLWLRTPGRDKKRAIYIYDGYREISTNHYAGAEVNTKYIAVRPVLRIGFKE